MRRRQALRSRLGARPSVFVELYELAVHRKAHFEAAADSARTAVGVRRELLQAMTNDLLEIHFGLQAGLSPQKGLPRLAFAETQTAERAKGSRVDQYTGRRDSPAVAGAVSVTKDEASN